MYHGLQLITPHQVFGYGTCVILCEMSPQGTGCGYMRTLDLSQFFNNLKGNLKSPIKKARGT